MARGVGVRGRGGTAVQHLPIVERRKKNGGSRGGA